MMMSEFIERTGYQPSHEEYSHIEESYYHFDGDKDAFCKQWKKDFKDGHWARELSFRKSAEQMQAEYLAKIEEQEENLKFYRAQFDESIKVRKELEEAREKLARLERAVKRVFEGEWEEIKPGAKQPPAGGVDNEHQGKAAVYGRNGAPQ